MENIHDSGSISLRIGAICAHKGSITVNGYGPSEFIPFFSIAGNEFGLFDPGRPVIFKNIPPRQKDQGKHKEVNAEAG